MADRAYIASPMRLLLWLRTPKLNKAGTAPVYLRIQDRHTGARAEVSTDIRCEPARWQGGEKKIRGRDAATLLDNEHLDTFKGHARRVASALQDEVRRHPGLPAVTPADVARALKPPVVAAEPLVSELLRAAIPHHSARIATQTGYGVAVDWWARWPGAAALRLAGLTVEAATAFVGWLAQQSPAPSSQRTYLAALAGLLATAAPRHPAVFARLRRLLAAAPEAAPQVLPADWLSRLQALALPRQQALARDAFLLAYYLHGSRIGAVLELRWRHVDEVPGRVRFLTHKYPVQQDVAITPPLAALLARYRRLGAVFVLPLLPSNYAAQPATGQYRLLMRAEQQLNEALGAVARKLGWPKLNPHLARHTFALAAYLKNNRDLRVPQQLLGHKRLSTTGTYIARLDSGQLDEGAANVYD